MAEFGLSGMKTSIYNLFGVKLPMRSVPKCLMTMEVMWHIVQAVLRKLPYVTEPFDTIIRLLTTPF